MAPVRGDGARDVVEIALDALRRQAAGPIGVHHDRDVTVLEPEGPGAVPRPPGRQKRRGPASRRRARRSCRAGPRLSCGHLQEPVVPPRSQRPLRRRAEATQRWSCARDRRNGGSRACGPPVRLRWAWLTGTSPVWYASTTTWTRSRRPSFWRMCVTWVLTVVSLM